MSDGRPGQGLTRFGHTCDTAGDRFALGGVPAGAAHGLVAAATGGVGVFGWVAAWAAIWEGDGRCNGGRHGERDKITESVHLDFGVW